MELLKEYSPSELKTTNAVFIPGLTKKAWEKKRGAREYQNYEDDAGNVLVREWYEYTYTNSGREIQDLNRYFAWYNEDGTEIQRVETTPDTTLEYIKEINMSVRRGRVIYMEYAVEDLINLAATVPEPYKTGYTQLSGALDQIFSHYESEIIAYRDRATLNMDWENAILNEADSTILDYLALDTSPPTAEFPNGLTAKTSILYQLKGDIP